MRKITMVMHGLVSILLAAAMAAPATGEPLSGNPASPDSHQTAYLGVHIDAVTPQQASALKLANPNGAVITDLDQDGPACKAGLKEQDVIVGLNGSKIESPEQLGDMIHVTQPGKTVTLTVVRRGETKDVKVILGRWPQVTPHGQSFVAGAPRWTGPVVAPGVINGMEIPSVTVLSSRHGLMVESLCPQLADFFNVPAGTGVLVRSVEKGSPADAAGLKAGDVIVRLNNETVHDMADWRRAMRVQASQVSVTVVREKHEQTVVMHLPPADSSKVLGQDWGNFGEQMQALGQEMEELDPEIESSQEDLLAELRPSQEELEQMRHEIEKSMKIKQKDMEKMAREIEKSVKPTQKQIEKMTRDIAKSARPTQQELDQMRHDIQESMKSWTPQLQQEMDGLRKQMEQQKLDLQQMMKGFGTEHEF
jgi:membrane-associated protease RseP (regulator of RpoE activity)